MTGSLGAADRPIPIICGPTASGKTDIALAFVAQSPVEIVSADSRQVVRYLDIGTAKPTIEERARVPFHLLDLIEPGERYSAFRFINDANRVITEIVKRGNQPMVVGGTGLYLRALTEGVVEIEENDMEVRRRLEQEMETVGPEAMHARLREIDPLEAAKIHPNNRFRVIRALEIFGLTGKTKSELTASGRHRKSNFQFAHYCLLPDRNDLYRRIDRRTEDMLERGWLREVEELRSRGIGPQVRAANIIGYNELLDYLEDKISLDEAVSSIKQQTRRYAKRQYTWFRAVSSCQYFATPEEVAAALESR